jgi:hypothetical protein
MSSFPKHYPTKNTACRAGSTRLDGGTANALQPGAKLGRYGSWAHRHTKSPRKPRTIPCPDPPVKSCSPPGDRTPPPRVVVPWRSPSRVRRAFPAQRRRAMRPRRARCPGRLPPRPQSFFCDSSDSAPRARSDHAQSSKGRMTGNPNAIRPDRFAGLSRTGDGRPVGPVRPRPRIQQLCRRCLVEGLVDLPSSRLLEPRLRGPIRLRGPARPRTTDGPERALACAPPVADSLHRPTLHG